METFSNLERANILQAKEKLRVVRKNIYDMLKTWSFDMNNLFISGGCIASLLQNEKPKDYDVYFKTQETMSDVSKILIQKIPSVIKDVDKNYRNVVVEGKMVTENAITVDGDIQFIIKNYGTPDVIRKSFDFVHCLPYYDFGTDSLFISRQQYDACFKKLIVYNNNSAVTMHRCRKFEMRGYKHAPVPELV